MIKNILKQLWNQRRTNTWIAVEMAFVFICLWFIVNLMVTQYSAFNRPMGFDIKDVYELKINNLPTSAVNYIDPQQSGTTAKEDMQTLLNRLRMIEGVECVSSSSQAKPYSLGNSTCMFMSVHGTDSIFKNGMFRIVTPAYFEVFRILTPENHPAGHEYAVMVVLSKGLADSLKVSRGDTVLVSGLNWKRMIVGISKEVRYAETWADVDNGYIVISEKTFFKDSGIPGEICVRLRPNLTSEQRDAVWERTKEVCRINNLSFFHVTSFKDIRERYLSKLVDEIKTQCWYAVFLLVNILLGIVGTFWFRTLHRRSEIGLRIAMGASRASIFRLLIIEGMLLLAVITPIVIVIQLNIAHFLMKEVSLLNLLLGGMITLVLMAVMIFLGIWYPAYQATKIEPAEALREE